MKFEVTTDGLRVLTPAKINLYLEVGECRADGFHAIDSLFQAVSLYDEIRFVRLPTPELRLDEEGIGDGESNLVWRAADLLRRSPLCQTAVPGVHIRLTKNIPQGAGLGGGSSDAAATLLALARLWQIDATREDLLPLAAELGSDVAFFLVGGTARCRGRGELVESWEARFEPYPTFHYVLAFPNVSVNTGDAYRYLDEARNPNFTLTRPSPLDSIPPALTAQRLGSGDLLFNRFEAVVYPFLPPLQNLYTRLEAKSFVRVLLSGSGSTIYGLCRSRDEALERRDQLAREVEGVEFHAVESLRAW